MGIDEFLNGHGSEVNVVVLDDGTVTIRDFGRGMPVGINDQGLEAFEASLTMTHAGGKFNNSGESGYNTSGGMNGVGLKAVNALSEVSKFTTMREGFEHTLNFEKGNKLGTMTKTKIPKKQTGTTVTYKPDKSIFTETILPDDEYIKKMLKEFSYLTKGLKFTFKHGEDSETFYSTLGLADYIADLNKNKTLISDMFYMDEQLTDGEVELALAVNSGSLETVKLYTNNIPNNEGRHLTGFRAALTRVANKYAIESKMLKAGEEKFSGEDLREGITLVISVKIVDPIFSGQTKEKLDDARGRTLVEKSFGEKFAEWLSLNPAQGKIIIGKAKLAKKARLAAKKARELTRTKTKSVLMSTLQGKLTDCISKDTTKNEIFLVEGLSAGGSAKSARDRNTQAILPLQGKILNAERHSLSKLFGNKEIQSLVSAIGCGFGPSFNITKLRYNKIVIMTDADVDGEHIKVLILTFFFDYMPELISGGHVYVSMPPLYKVIYGKKFKYLLDDNELRAFSKTHSNYEIQRFKGLGEMDAEELKVTTMEVKNRKLKQVTMDDPLIVRRTISDLMGAGTAARKVFIAQNAYRAEISS